MEDEDDEKDSRKYKTYKTTRPPVSFVWGSPLHKMVDPTETDPYDIVEFLDVSHDTNNQEQQSTLVDSKENKEWSTNANIFQCNSDHESIQNTFAQFGYNLSELDTSENNETEPSFNNETFLQNDRDIYFSTGNIEGVQANITLQEIHNNTELYYYQHEKTGTTDEEKQTTNEQETAMGKRETAHDDQQYSPQIEREEASDLPDPDETDNAEHMAKISKFYKEIAGKEDIQSLSSSCSTLTENSCFKGNESVMEEQLHGESLSCENDVDAQALKAVGIDDVFVKLNTEASVQMTKGHQYNKDEEVVLTPSCSNNTKDNSMNFDAKMEETEDTKLEQSRPHGTKAELDLRYIFPLPFHQNVRSPEENKSFDESMKRSVSRKTPVVKKEYDNSIELMTDLFNIGAKSKQTNDDVRSKVKKSKPSKVCPQKEEENTCLTSNIETDKNIENGRSNSKATSIEQQTVCFGDNGNQSIVAPDSEITKNNEENQQQDSYRNQFSIIHFGKYHSFSYMHSQNETIDLMKYKLTYTSETNDDILFTYNAKCRHLETVRYSSKPHTKNNHYSLSTEYWNNPEYCKNYEPQNWPESDLSFEMQANQPLNTSNMQREIPSHRSWEKSKSLEGQARSPDETLQALHYNFQQKTSMDKQHSQSFGQEENRWYEQPRSDDNQSQSQDYRQDTRHSWRQEQTTINDEQNWSYHDGNLRFIGQNGDNSRHGDNITTRNPENNQVLVTNTPFSRRHYRTSWHTEEGECSCASCMIKEHLTTLSKYMESMGYEVKNVSGDGNCLFAAVVDQLRINGDFTYTTDSLRKKSVQYLRKTPHVEDDTHLEAFLINETWIEYLDRMELDGEWGDDIILRGISEMTGRKIVVYSSFISKTTLTPTKVYEKDELYIGHIRHMMHFVSLRPQFWKVIWPMAAMIRRYRQVADDLNLGKTILSSCEDITQQKIQFLKEALLRGDLQNGHKMFDEIKKILQQMANSCSEETLTTVETPDTLDKLVHETSKLDRLSGVPMMHLSFLIKLLIKPKYFRIPDEDFENLFDKNIVTRIGSGSLGLNVELMDFTSAMQHFTILGKRSPKEKQPVTYTLVIKLPKDHYNIQEDSTPISDRSLIIDDSATLPGFVRLRPCNTAYWTGCVEWVSSQEPFLCGLKVKRMKGLEFREFNQISVKKFEGLECFFWPKQAQAWTKRKPSSGWPSAKKIIEASEKGCLLIRRANEFSEDADIEWQYVFTAAEKVLVASFENSMVYCFRIFKTLVDHQTMHLTTKLKTYCLLTAMFYCSEIIPKYAWSSNPGGCIMYLTAWLLKQVRERFVPHYFIPDNNIIEYLEDDEEVRRIEYNLQALRWFPFASFYFLFESHSFLHLSVVDQIESSIEEYKQSKDRHKVLETVFVPICLKLANDAMKTKIIPFYLSALEYVETAYEQTLDLQVGDHQPSFEEFIMSFLASVHDETIKLQFAQVVDKEKKSKLCQTLLNNNVSQPLKDILGPAYTGEWGHVYLDVSEDKWNAIYKLTGTLYQGLVHEECAEILRFSIAKLRTELNDEQADYSEITNSVIKKQIQESNYKRVYFTLRWLVTFYKHLSKCYEAMDKIEIFQEHIHDYEDIASRIDSYMHFETLSKIYRKLGNTDKAKELDEKATSLRPMKTDQRTAVMIILR